MVARDLFARYVKNALTRLYDPAHLQTHPLVNLLGVSRAPEETQSQSLRHIFTEAIDSLRPEDSVPFGRPEWLSYRVMWLRYGECLSRSEVCRELGFSRTSFYRHHRKALDAVVSVLWETRRRRPTLQGDGTKGLRGLSATQRAKEEALRAARASRRQWADLGEVLEGARRTVLPLAEQRGITLLIRVPGSAVTIYGDPGILRQIILSMLAEGINLATGKVLELTVTLRENATLWRLRGLDQSKAPERSIQRVAGFAVGQELLRVYNGSLWFERDERRAPVLCFTMPTARPKTVFIVDDNADTIDLYQRYLQAGKFVVSAARSRDQLWALLAEAKPDLILLDVLMPQSDGWDILQRLKTMPETAAIPVVICSVLSQPQLALALGAVRVLQKPVDQEVLLETVQALLASEDSAG